MRTSSTLCLMVLALLAVGGCVKNESRFNTQQQAVYDAMQAWSRACERRDTAAMWEMLSKDAQRFYTRELIEHVRPFVKMNKATLQPGSIISDKRRKELEEDLAALPADPENMTPAEYYAWRIDGELTPGAVENQTRLFSEQNVENIELDGERATAVLRNGDPRRYFWRKEGGDWKFDVMPSMLRALGATGTDASG